MNKQLMLIVDDAVINRRILHKIFERDFECLEAEDGDKALTIMKEKKDRLSVVLLDINMPKKNGYEVLEAISYTRDLKHIPIIAITSENTSEVEILNRGAWDFISKPFHTDTVKTRVKSVVNRNLITTITAQNAELKARAQIYGYINDMPVAFLVLHLEETKKGQEETLVLEYCNRSYADLRGVTVQELLGKELNGLYAIDSTWKAKECYDVAKNGGEYGYEQDGVFDVNKHYSVYLYSPSKGSCACLIQDITNIHDLQRENIAHLECENKLLLERSYEAQFDVLTGIYSANNFYRYTQALLDQNPDTVYVIIRLDIYRFKIINELFGHGEGDKLLRYIAQELAKDLRIFEQRVYGRIEADIFCMCVPYEHKQIEKLLGKIDYIAKDYPLNFDVIPSIGLCRVDTRDVSVEILCDRASLALKTIKGNYMERHAYFDDTMRLEIQNEQEILNMMKTALENDHFQVYLQPKYQLQNNAMAGAEALVRWIHPQKGMIYPNDFIPIFERNGFIMKLDEYVWETVCKVLRRWIDEGKDPLPISVNVSKVNIYNPQLCDVIISLVEKYQLPPKLLQLELTESAYTDNAEVVLDVMKRLQGYGFVIMMDDFGSRYSSLNMLKELPVDVLKIDLKFLAGDDLTGKGGNILSSVVRMAKWLNLHIIAEGIETKEQSDFLKSIGCADGQGYYFAKPMPIVEYEALVFDAEKRRIKYEELETSNHLNIDDIWSPSAQVNLLFNSIISAVAIYEMNGDTVEILRVNDGYVELTEDSYDIINNVDVTLKQVIHPDDYEQFIDIFERAKRTTDFAEGNFRRDKKNGNMFWVNLKLKYLSGVGDRYVFYGALSDITDEKKMEEKLQRTLFELETMIHVSSAGVCKFYYDDEKKYEIIYANDVFYSSRGYTKEQFEKEEQNNLESIMLPEDSQGAERIITKAIEEGQDKTEYELRVRCRNGEIKTFLCNVGIMYTEDEIIINSIDSDITSMKSMELQLKTANEQLQSQYTQERHFRETVVANAVAFYEIDLTHNIIVDGDQESLGTMGHAKSTSFEELITDIAETKIHPDDKDMFLTQVNYQKLLLDDQNDLGEVKVEYRVRSSEDGEYDWIEGVFTFFECKDNSHRYCMWTSQDINDRKEYELLLKEKADRDALTELYNCISFQEIVSNYLERYQNGVCYMLDIDNFKRINDTKGHAYGDEILKIVAFILNSSFTSTSIVARMGGDEFAVFLPGQFARNKIEEFAQNTCRKVNEIQEQEEVDICFSCSLGVAIVDKETTTYDQLYKNADKAQYFSKRGGKNQYAIYESNQPEKKQRILVADDVEMHRMILRGILCDKYEVLEAFDGLEVEKVLEAYGTGISAVVLDNMMPHKTGLEVLEDMKKRREYRAIPVIMTTMYSEPEIKMKALELGAVYFIDKPFDSGIVSRLVDNVIQLKS
ncbi:MAG: EAL domain-containing protein [Lachnospiraceae bacterium]